MTITVNGQPRELPATATVQDLLESLRMDPARVAVEHNRAIVPKVRFAETALGDGDRLEIVQFVGGG
ncbi:MAG: sulfur carrier protein ThiS [Desulfuromonadales bacterium]|jgi:thiamine biosynthesis protein ThiS